MLSKKCLFTLIFLCSISIIAQDALNRGVYSLGGSISYSNGSNKSTFIDYDNQDFIMTPSVNYFVINDLSLGLRASFIYSELKFNATGFYPDGLHIDRTYSLGPEIRYYFRKDGIAFFVDASYEYSNSTEGNNDGNQITAGAGINYFLSKAVALEPFLMYRKGNYIKNDQKISEFFVGLRINYFILD